MAHILCITSGLTGILYASIEMCKRLERAGHQVTYASPSDVQEKVIANHISYTQLPSLQRAYIPFIPDAQNRNRWTRLWYRIKNRHELQQAAIEQLKMKEFETVLEELTPDLVIVDIELHAHIMTVFSKKVPFLLLSHWFSLWNSAGLPPLLQDTIPGVGWNGSKLGLKWAWWKIRQKRRWKFFKMRLLSLGMNRRSIFKKYAQQVRFPLRYIRENYWPGPFSYAELPVISINIEELEFPHDKRPNLHYVGAMIDVFRSKNIDEATDIKLEHILQLKKERNAKLIYCSVSSMKSGDQQFLECLTTAVSQNKNWLLVMSLGGQINLDKFNELPANVFTFSWIPQMKVLANADCSINHGGIHTINECVHFQVPMLVYSGKRADQNGCAARVHYHQLGLMADKDIDTVDDISSKIQEVLNNPIYKVNLQKMNEVYQVYETEKRLEKVISRHFD